MLALTWVLAKLTSRNHPRGLPVWIHGTTAAAEPQSSACVTRQEIRSRNRPGGQANPGRQIRLKLHILVSTTFAEGPSSFATLAGGDGLWPAYAPLVGQLWITYPTSTCTWSYLFHPDCRHFRLRIYATYGLQQRSTTSFNILGGRVL